MDSEFEKLKPEIRNIHYQKVYQRLYNSMYKIDRDIPFELELHLLILNSKNELHRDSETAFYAQITLDVIKQIKKEYQALKLIS